LFAPLLGVWLLPHDLSTRKSAHGASRIEAHVRRAVVGALNHRWIVIGVTLVLFALALFGATRLQQQFFPQSDRNGLLGSLTLRESGGIGNAGGRGEGFEALVGGDDDVARWSFYIGSGAVRFYLPMDVQLANDFFAQAVVVAKDIPARERLRTKLTAALGADF